jgi:hypothetical protein
MSYGYSLWLIFKNKPIFMVSNMIKIHNKLPHIPHITLKTNLSSIPTEKTIKCLPKTMRFSIHETPIIFTSQYENDPLYSWGFSCDISQEYKISHTPHLTIGYGKNPFETIPDIRIIPFKSEGKVVVADTTSINPWEWEILNP